MDATYAAAHAQEDGRHWYFRGRLAVLTAVLRRALGRRRVRLVEIGCGAGSVLAALREFGDAVGVECNDTLRDAARASGLDVRPGALPGDLGIPAGSADVVLLLDVVEHLDDDVRGLREARRLLADRGSLVVTVPAYPWLWSAHDVVLGHRRRYTAGRLRRVVEAAGYRVERVSYFNTVLFPAIASLRLWKRLRRDDRHDLVRPRAALNAALEFLFALERHVLPVARLPFGVSLLLIARRS